MKSELSRMEEQIYFRNLLIGKLFCPNIVHTFPLKTISKENNCVSYIAVLNCIVYYTGIIIKNVTTL